jgi:hypothetical protein
MPEAEYEDEAEEVAEIVRKGAHPTFADLERDQVLDEAARATMTPLVAKLSVSLRYAREQINQLQKKTKA